MKFAWIENNRIRDIAHDDPTLIYHPDVAVFYDTQVPDDAQNGDGWVNGQLVKPEPAPPAPSPARTWSADTVRSKLTLAERVKWDNDKSDAIKTAKVEFSSPCDEAHTREVLQLLVDAGDISASTMQAILA